MTPRIHNKHHKTAPPDAVYVGRGSPYGNPFVIGADGDRDEVCEKYEQMILRNDTFIRHIKTNLKGRDLVCYCYPKRCHAETLMRIANEDAS